MANVSAASIISVVVITVGLVATILSLAVDRWGQFSLTVAGRTTKVLCAYIEL